MGDYTYTDMIKYVKFRMGRRTDLESVDSEDLYGLWVNRAYRELTSKNVIFGIKGFHNRVYFPEFETLDDTQATTDGTAYISVPSDALIIRGVWDSENDRILDRISWETYIGYTGRATATSESKPTQWVRRGFHIYLYSTPDDAYDMTIYYRKKITTDLSGTDTTGIGMEWDDAVVQLATYKGLMWMNDIEGAQVVKAEFKETVAEMLGIYFQDEIGKTTYMGPHPAYNKK